MKTYEQFISNKPNKFSVVSWIPKKHFRYWFYTYMLKLNFGNKWKRYWFHKKCNFINKPFMDAFKRLSTFDKKVDFSTKKIGSLAEHYFEWEIITEPNEVHDKK